MEGFRFIATECDRSANRLVFRGDRIRPQRESIRFHWDGMEGVCVGIVVHCGPIGGLGGAILSSVYPIRAVCGAMFNRVY